MPDSECSAEGVDLAESLGVDSGVSAQCFSIYVPDKDRFGEEIGFQRKWVLEALRLLGEINGGATALPPSEGVWLNEEGTVIGVMPS